VAAGLAGAFRSMDFNRGAVAGRVPA
jgi:hypothetical protein